MAATIYQNEAVVQNLRDADCDQAMIERFLRLMADGCREEALCLLAIHRGCLLDKLHDAQKPLDNLDFLIYKLRKEGGVNK